jgi:hypothetical protein
MPNILRVSSHDKSQRPSNHSTQSLAVSGSHCRFGRRSETTRRTSSARTMKAVSFMLDGIATMQGSATDSRDRERGLCSTTARSSAGEERSSVCYRQDFLDLFEYIIRMSNAILGPHTSNGAEFDRSRSGPTAPPAPHAHCAS